MTPDELARLRALAEAATPGPWFISGGWVASSKATIVDGSWAWDTVRNEAHMVAHDLRYISALNPETTTALLDRIDRQSALCAAMAQWLANQQHWTDLPDDHPVLESRATDGTAEYRITAGMIRAANGGTGA